MAEVLSVAFLCALLPATPFQIPRMHRRARKMPRNARKTYSGTERRSRRMDPD